MATAMPPSRQLAQARFKPTSTTNLRSAASTTSHQQTSQPASVHHWALAKFSPSIPRNTRTSFVSTPKQSVIDNKGRPMVSSPPSGMVPSNPLPYCPTASGPVPSSSVTTFSVVFSVCSSQSTVKARPSSVAALCILRSSISLMH